MLSQDDRAQGESERPSIPHWYALYTHSHCEKLLYKQLLAEGFHAFLPKIEFGRAARARTGRKMRLSCPPERSAAMSCVCTDVPKLSLPASYDG
jgi:hypothetical protein